ncbi:MAG: hypothetical protein KKF48_05435 [Nanoarchaeota archaeon]|nr:hypothetical protein [Nanoarchaeota archaeon]MBU1028459.1 hypothetical protein [Nanoarchaeota archaeon]
MTNIYINERREILKNCKSDTEMNLILEIIYDEGYNDGVRECREQISKIKA